MSFALNPLVLCLSSLCLLCISIEARSRPSIDDRIVFPKDSDEDAFSSRFSLPSANSTTTTEIASTTKITSLPTTGTTELVSSGSEELNTEKPVVDNRILIETSPKCKEGFELRANRCRKSA
ncbi:hypothetical protein KR038_003205 [Drosophila bunnanda]|nr:hypothetical protein KR038_003205 [Drosophila bunnanda]